ncbi:GNAT family N-acetyltransferase [Azospirillum thermophilum]|uniref:N-acetyltransferase domain-containing protein n=1 Tax=Azospirillum thermophilum TaxID=2202148 RepID=A0A2S2CM88_9PROT|nr:GNAT family N-acetyltransferase [Azospirillum thermophilum]AWK85576.1 hypothetical protein DEW08_04815 [Azospirillum thermophilum]
MTPDGYGPLGPADRDSAARLARLGFGHPRELFDRYAALFGEETLRGVRAADGTVAGCAAVWTMAQWFGGRPVPARAVAMVAVDPALRGRGIGSGLMRGVLAEAAADGAALSVLHPATLPFYARLGYGRGGVTVGWSAPPAALDAGPVEDGRILPGDPRDAAPLAVLRRRLLAEETGLPERTEAMWTLALSPDGEPAEVFLLAGPDGPEGYIAVAPPRDRQLVVADCCLPTRRAIRLAMGLLAGYRAQVETVRWLGGPEDPIALLSREIGVRPDSRKSGCCALWTCAGPWRCAAIPATCRAGW